MIHSRLGCSTISFRHLALDRALGWIGALGFAEVDLGALPGVCDHVPYVLDRAAAMAAHYRLNHQLRSIEGIKAESEGHPAPRR